MGGATSAAKTGFRTLRIRQLASCAWGTVRRTKGDRAVRGTSAPWIASIVLSCGPNLHLIVSAARQNVDYEPSKQRVAGSLGSCVTKANAACYLQIIRSKG